MVDYAGDLTSKQAWDLLSSNKGAVLIDVRTAAEWNFVGIPELGGVGKQVVLIEWSQFPGGVKNPEFQTQLAEQLKAQHADENAHLLFICRSGQRSKAAAIAATSLGYQKCLNISDGFEGAMDEDGHRGTINGWRASGLPWRQT